MTPTPAVSAKEKALEALTSAREQLEGYERGATGESYNDTQINAAIEGLRAALSATEGEAEPVAWLQEMYGEMRMSDARWFGQGAFPVYASPPSAPAGVKELVRASTALLNNLWQEVWSHERTHDENWKEFDRKFSGVKWLRDARDAARSSLQPDTQAAAASEPAGDFPKPGRRDGLEPCGECHIKPDETCDICGAQHPAPAQAEALPAGVEQERVNKIIDDFAEEQDALMRRTLNRAVGEMASIKKTAARQIKDLIAVSLSSAPAQEGRE